MESYHSPQSTVQERMETVLPIFGLFSPCYMSFKIKQTEFLFGTFRQNPIIVFFFLRSDLHSHPRREEM